MRKFIYVLLLLFVVQTKLFANGSAPAWVSLTITGTSWSASWANTGDPYYYLMITTSPTFPDWSGGLSTSGATSYSGSGLTPGVTYYVYVTGVDAGWGWSTTTRSNPDEAENPCSGTSSPGWSSGSATGLYSANLSWGTASGTAPITYYWNVYTSGGSWVTGSSSSGTSASTSSLSPNTTYYVNVYAYNCGGYSSSVSSSYFTTYPTDPSSISVSTNPVCNGNSTTLTANNAQGTVYWYTGGCGSSFYTTGSSISVSPSSATTYYARNYNGNWSSGCASATVSVNQPVTTPSSPSVSSIGTTTANLSWGAASGTATITYYWVIGTSSSVAYGSGTAQGSTTSTTATATALSPGVTYYLRVYANNMCGNSGYVTSSSFTMQQLTQSISFSPIATKTYGNSSFNPGATATSSLTVSYSSSNTSVATVSGSTINIVGAGTSVITASQSGNVTYSAATSVQQTLTVNKAAALTVTANDKSKVYGATDPTLNYTSTGTLYNGDTYAVITGVNLSTDIGAAATWGTHTITASGGSASNYEVTHVNGTLTVSKATLTVINAVAHDKIYDTNTDAVISGTQLSGVFYGGTVTLGNQFAGTFSQANVGYGLAVTTAMTITGADAFNYNLTQPNYLEADIIPGPLHHFTVAGITDPVIAGTPTTLVVTAYDYYNNLKTNYTGTITLTSDDVQAVLPAPFTFSAGDNGSKTFTNGVTLKTTGEHYVRATDGSVNNEQSEITVTPAVIGHFTLTTQNAGNETAGTAFSVTATAYDIFGNLKTNYTGPENINWSSNATASGNGTTPILASNGSVTFSSGVATISGFKLFNAHETPTITITETATGKLGTTAPINVSYVALANFLVVTGTTQVAGTPFDVTVTARDQYYNTVKNYAGNISFKSSNNALVSFPVGPQSLAGYNGVRTFSNAININIIGTFWLRAADALVPIILGTQYNINVIPGAFSAAQSTVAVDYNTRIAGEYVGVTVTPRDAQGNLLGAGKTVAVRLDGLTTDYNGAISVTDLGNGIYAASVRVTNTTAANVISATVNGALINQTQTITVLPAVASLPNIVITAAPTTITADETSAITVQLKDQFNNNLTTSSGVVALYTTVGTLSTVSDNADGTYAAILSTNISGTATITGTLSASAINDNATVLINEGLPSMITSTIEAVPELMTTDQTSIITVQLKDQYGNNLSTSRGLVALSTNLGLLSAVTDNANGTYTATLSANNTGTGIATIAATLASVALLDDEDVTITEGAPSLSQSTITANPTSMTTDGGSSITVQLKDQHGNLLSTSRGTVLLSTTLGVLSSVTDNGDGTYSATLLANNTGTGLAIITGQLNASALTDDAQVTIIEGVPVLGMISITAAPTSMTTDQTSLITVQLKDQFGNNLTSSRGTVSLSTDLGVLSNVIDNNNGTYTATLSANNTGTGIATISGHFNGNPIIDNAQVTITAGLPAVADIEITAAPTSITADETSTITVQLKDQHGNLLHTSGGAITLQTNLGALSAVTDHADGTYTAILSPNFSGTGTATITGKLNAVAIADEAYVDITFGVATHLVISTQPSNTAIAGVDFTQQPVIRIEDQYNNLVADDNSTLITAISNGTIELTGSRILSAVNGIVTFTNLSYERAETITIGISAPGLIGATTSSIVVSPAPTAYFTLNAPADIIAGGIRAAYTVTRYDEFNNLVVAGSQTVYLYTESSGTNAEFYNAASLGSTITQVNIPNGASTANFWYYDEKTGDWTITASDATPALDGIIGISDGIDEVTVKPAALLDFAVSGIANPHYYGSYQSVTVAARDIFYNIKTDYTGTITFQITDPDAQGPADYTFQSSDMGQVTFNNEILFSEEGIFWVTVLDVDEPAYYGYQENIHVEKMPITITANDRSKVYGQELVMGTSEFTVTGTLAPGESITQVDLASTGYANYSNTGVFAITTANAMGTGGFDAANYDITYSSDGELTVTPAELVVTANSGQSKIYGSLDPVFTYNALGFVVDDDISIMTGALGRIAGENTGNYALTVGTLSAGSNYTISFTSADFSITPKSLEVTADDGQTKIYGASDPVYTYSVSGFAFADGLGVMSGTLDRVGGEEVGAYDITVGSLAAGANYTIAFITNEFNIVPKTLEVTANAGQQKVYATSDPVFTYTVTGFEFGDNGSLVTGALGRVSGEDVGAYDMTIGSLTVTGNYVLSFNTDHFNITPKELTVTADAGQTKSFGQADPVFTYTVTGFEFSDDLTLMTGALSRDAGEAAGLYDITVGNLAAGDNYTIDFVSNEFEITSMEIIVFADMGLAKIYGDTDPVFTYTYYPLSLDADDFTGALSRVAGESSGLYAITLGTLSAGGNYTINLISQNFGISAKPITVTPDFSQSKVYGDTDPVYTYSVNPGLIGTDVLNGTLSRAAGEDVGDYEMNVGSLNGGFNYTISFVPEDFSITPKGITVIPDAGQSKVYGYSDPSLSYSITPALFNSDVVTGALGRNAGEDAGIYAMTIGTLTAGSNYSLSIMSEDFTINPRPLTLNSFSANNKTYDGSVSATGTGFTDNRLAGDQLNFTYTAAFDSKHAGTSKNVNYSAIAINGGADMQNYTLVTVTGQTTANIDARPLHLLGFAASNKVYDGTTNVSGTGFVDDRVPGDMLSFTLNVQFEDKNVGNGKLVLYDGIDINGGADRYNYALVSNTGAAYANITARPLMVTASASDKVYDGNTSVTVALDDNRIAGDDLTLEYASASFNNATADVNKPVTLNGVSIFSGQDEQNYSLSSTVTTYATIYPKELFVIADNIAKCDDGEPYNGGYSVYYSGFVNSEGPSVFQNTLEFSGDAITAYTPGAYTIIPDGLTAENYEITFQEGTLEIKPTPTAIADGGSSVCAGSPDAEIVFTGINGVAPYTFVYSINGGLAETVSSATGDIATLSQSTAATGSFAYNLLGVEDVNGCASEVGWIENIVVNPSPAVPSGSSAQSFCNSATLADLNVTGTAINWYDAEVGGNELSSFTSTVDGGIYYADQVLDGCTSNGRLEVEVSINSPEPPTGLTTQIVCNAGVVNDFVLSGSNINWYDASVDGNELDPATTVLINGEHYFATQTIDGCESAERLTVTASIANATTASLSLSNCGSYEWFGTTYTTSGQYVHMMNNVAGCDSTITLDLTINESTASTIAPVACEVYTSPEGNEYTTSGVYNDTIANAAGCDSVITINLTIDLCTGIEANASNDFKFYPNPVSDVLIIEGADQALIEVMDMIGNTVLSVNAEQNKVALNVAPLAAGVYFVRITKNDQINIQKIEVKR